MKKQKILIGNSFPLSLIRNDVVISPCPLETLLSVLENAETVSFWGHRNTLTAVNQLLNHDLTPKTERPALVLSPNRKPMLDGEEFSECWILSPDYRENFRPAIGVEVTADSICNWQCLKIIF